MAISVRWRKHKNRDVRWNDSAERIEMTERTSQLHAVIVIKLVVRGVARNGIAWPKISTTSSDFDAPARLATGSYVA